MNLEIQPYQPFFSHKEKREAVGSRAFNLELYDTPPKEGELRRDIISYLGEYRLQVPKYSYDLIFGRDKNREGAITLRDIDRGEDLHFKAKRAIVERTLLGDPTHREDAEDKGLNRLQQQLGEAKTGDSVLWASPPGPKEQGYGEYGFIYAGRVTKLADGEAHLAMSAIRIENPTLKQYNNVMGELSGDNILHISPEGFLANPKLIPFDMPPEEIDRALKKHFSLISDRKAQDKFAAIINRMTPMIDDFVEVMRYGTKKEKLISLYTLENYALELKNEDVYSGEHATEKTTTNATVVFRRDTKHQEVRLHHVIHEYGYKPPVVPGSCGSTGESTKSNSLTSMNGGEQISLSIYGSDKHGSREFKCPVCNQTNVREKNELKTNCDHCGTDKVAC